ncbi:MAG: hypothetical protein H6760_01045 [Candidatus Nomurabacteria bacterium]|nr:MAG: hypothetical protein H6760_01045 [Candidatus Nomurabacteria bacterium]
MRESEGFSPEFMENESDSAMSAEAAEANFIDEGAQQCVVIEPGNIDVQTVTQFATEQGALIEDEDGGNQDRYVIRFPEGEQQALTYEELRDQIEVHAQEWAEAA